MSFNRSTSWYMRQDPGATRIIHWIRTSLSPSHQCIYTRTSYTRQSLSQFAHFLIHSSCTITINHYLPFSKQNIPIAFTNSKPTIGQSVFSIINVMYKLTAFTILDHMHNWWPNINAKRRSIAVARCVVVVPCCVSNHPMPSWHQCFLMDIEKRYSYGNHFWQIKQ